MKKLPSIKAFVAIIAIILANIVPIQVINGSKNIKKTVILNDNNLSISSIGSKRLLQEVKVNNELLAINDVVSEEKTETPKIVYNGMTLKELSKKLDKNLKSTLSGQGATFAKYSMQYEVDPYVALAIVLHETGCGTGKCSKLTVNCNNIGGMKGKTTCGNGSSYAKFKTLDAGIEAFFKNLSKNYYQKGLTTPEAIGKKYAESTTWASKVNAHIRQIKNS